MEKSDRPANKESWFKEDEIVDADLLVDLLETYRFGKAYVSARENGSNVAVMTEPPPPDNTTEMENEDDHNGSQGNKSVLENTSSLSSNSDPIVLDAIMSETGSNKELGTNGETGSYEELSSNEDPGSVEETGYNWLESNSTNLPDMEKEMQQNSEDGEIEEEVESERSSSSSELEENSNFKKLLATQENYELYCPSCSSCITRRVILKKRKRTGKHIDLSVDMKPIVDEPDESSDIEEMEPPVKIHVPETTIEDDEEENLESDDDDDDDDKDKGDIFTCLACLKYFIRLGARFLQLDYIRGKPVEEPEIVCDGTVELDESPVENIDAMIPPSYAAAEIDQLDPTAENVPINSSQLEESKLPDVSSNENEPEVNLEAETNSNIPESPPQKKPDRERFAVELLKSTVYGGLTETITSLGVVASASASGSSTLNILALAVANLAGGLVVLAQNVHDLRNSSNKEKDRYEELLGRRANFRVHILVAVMSYILFGLIPPLVYAFSFYETGVKNYKLISVFTVSLVCVILLGMIKVYAQKPPNVRESPKLYLKSAAYYTSIVAASSGISYFVGDIAGEYIEKLGWFSLDQVGMTSPFDGSKLSEYQFTSF